MEKATRRQVKRHNQQLVLRAIYEGVADNRAALARETSLTKPTVSTIVSDLIDVGLVEEGGRGESTSSGGKRARLLNFIPTARQLIAITINTEQILGCLAYLDGAVIARHHVSLQQGNDIYVSLTHAINALIAQTDAPLMCVCIGVPGRVNEDEGMVDSSPSLGWYDVPLADELYSQFDLPIFLGNNTEFATRARYTSSNDAESLVTIFVGDTIEIGSTLDGNTYQYGGDIAALEAPNGKISRLEWQNIQQRVQDLVNLHPESALNVEQLTYLHIKRGIFLQDETALFLLEDISVTLTHIYAWILALMRPTQIVLAGQMSLIGKPLLNAVQQKLEDTFDARTLGRVSLTLAQDDDLTLQGAIANALQKELGIV